MTFSWRFDCEHCAHKDRLIFLVSSKRFAVNVLAKYICQNAPAQKKIAERLSAIPPHNASPLNARRLILIDCLGLSGLEITTLLNTECTPYIHKDIIALFNLARKDVEIPLLINIGVRGFFFEDDQAELILKGICALKNEELWVTRGDLMEYVSRQPAKIPSAYQSAKQLTPREKEVVHLIAAGSTNGEISNQLCISPHTVKSHVYNIFKKLGLQNRIQAALWVSKYLP